MNSIATKNCEERPLWKSFETARVSVYCSEIEYLLRRATCEWSLLIDVTGEEAVQFSGVIITVLTLQLQLQVFVGSSWVGNNIGKALTQKCRDVLIVKIKYQTKLARILWLLQTYVLGMQSSKKCKNTAWTEWSVAGNSLPIYLNLAIWYFYKIGNILDAGWNFASAGVMCVSFNDQN